MELFLIGLVLTAVGYFAIYKMLDHDVTPFNTVVAVVGIAAFFFGVLFVAGSALLFVLNEINASIASGQTTTGLILIILAVATVIGVFLAWRSLR